MTLALIPAALTRDLSFLAPASALGVVAYALAYVAIFVDGAKRQTESTSHIISHALLASPHAATWSAVVDSFGVICFSMGLPVLTFQVQRSMTQPTAFMTVLNVTLILVTALYVIIGAGGASLYANSAIGVQAIILSNINQNSITGTIIKGIVAVTLILTAPLSLVPALNTLETIVYGDVNANEHSSSSSTSSSLSESTPLLVQPKLLHTQSLSTSSSVEDASGFNTPTPTMTTTKPFKSIIVHSRIDSRINIADIDTAATVTPAILTTTNASPLSTGKSKAVRFTHSSSTASSESTSTSSSSSSTARPNGLDSGTGVVDVATITPPSLVAKSDIDQMLDDDSDDSDSDIDSDEDAITPSSKAKTIRRNSFRRNNNNKNINFSSSLLQYFNINNNNNNYNIFLSLSNLFI